jgi:hypothetical protein
MRKRPATKGSIATSKQGKALRKLGKANLSHGAYELERLGYRPCRPQHCPARKVCEQAAIPAKNRPKHCQPLEKHVQTIVGALLTGKGLSSHRKAIIDIVAQRAAQLWLFKQWFTHISPVYSNNGRVYLQPAFLAYERLLSAQAKDLNKLGASEDLHMTTSDDRNVIEIITYGDDGDTNEEA